jgi:E3 ubiquitin-protein ligase BAH
MKFARQFQESLTNDGYPASWVQNAISYGQLKKCVKRVQKELSSIGLDVDTLRTLLATVEAQENSKPSPAKKDPFQTQRNASVSSTNSDDAPLQYTFAAPSSSSKRIVPKLLFVVDATTGEPISAALSPETRNLLHQLAVSEKLTNVRITPESDEFQLPLADVEDSERDVQYIQIPLNSDSEFFTMLEQELTGLAALQNAEREKLTSDILEVGSTISKATNPDDKKGRQDLLKWRALLECYVDAEVFFATNEQDHGIRGSKEASKRYAEFLANAKSAGLLTPDGYRGKDGRKAVQMFLNVNEELMQCLRFQEINRTAMSKILKSKYFQKIAYQELI